MAYVVSVKTQTHTTVHFTYLSGEPFVGGETYSVWRWDQGLYWYRYNLNLLLGDILIWYSLRIDHM